jgi:hypothetical protein
MEYVYILRLFSQILATEREIGATMANIEGIRS